MPAAVVILAVLPQGFREKNRDLMRQDIVDVLKTSRMDLVRALIGQLPYAVRCWRIARLKLMAAFAFRLGISVLSRDMLGPRVFPRTGKQGRFTRQREKTTLLPSSFARGVSISSLLPIGRCGM